VKRLVSDDRRTPILGAAGDVHGAIGPGNLVAVDLETRGRGYRSANGRRGKQLRRNDASLAPPVLARDRPRSPGCVRGAGCAWGAISEYGARRRETVRDVARTHVATVTWMDSRAFWRPWVRSAWLVRDQGVAGSNPVSPTWKAAILLGKPVDRGLRCFTVREPSAVVLQRRPAVDGVRVVAIEQRKACKHMITAWRVGETPPRPWSRAGYRFERFGERA
jgi:hypothetical protein